MSKQSDPSQDGGPDVSKTSVQEEKMIALSRLAGGLAHDFNNILSIIEGYSNLLTKNSKDPALVQSYAHKMHKAVKRATDLTQKMTLFSHHQPDTNCVINLADMLPTHFKHMQDALPVSLTIDLNIPKEDHFYVRSCNDALNQIITELTQNALDAIEENTGTLTVSLALVDTVDALPVSAREDRTALSHAIEAGQSFIHLSVQDNGSGIDPAARPYIFDPFFTTRDQGAQSGLGLSLVYGFVKQLGGHLYIQSDQNTGTCVDILLPQSEAEATVQSINGSPDAPAQIKLQGYTALLVDDEKDLVAILKQMLSTLGLHVLTASSMNEALIIQDDFEGKIDFLLTDISMPGGSGTLLSHTLTSLRPNIKTIYMSGYPERRASDTHPQSDLQSNSHSQAPLLTKPIDFDNLALLLYSLSTDTPLDQIPLAKTGTWKEPKHA